MKIEKFHVYLADLNPQRGTEPGKVRPVVVVQTDLLNNIHPSTVVCPITSNVILGAEILRVHVMEKSAGLEGPSDILVDQVRAIDNRRFIKHLGKLTETKADQLMVNLQTLVLG